MPSSSLSYRRQSSATALTTGWAVMLGAHIQSCPMAAPVTHLRVSKTKQISAIPPSFHRAHLLQNSHDSSSIQHQRRVEPESLVNA
jgi:hypothetical protein